MSRALLDRKIKLHDNETIVKIENLNMAQLKNNLRWNDNRMEIGDYIMEWNDSNYLIIRNAGVVGAQIAIRGD